MNTFHIKRGSVRQGKYDVYWSKDNEWAIIDDEEEEENERRLKEAYHHHPRLSSRYLTAGLFVVLVPAMCGLLWCCRTETTHLTTKCRKGKKKFKKKESTLVIGLPTRLRPMVLRRTSMFFAQILAPAQTRQRQARRSFPKALLVCFLRSHHEAPLTACPRLDFFNEFFIRQPGSVLCNPTPPYFLPVFGFSFWAFRLLSRGDGSIRPDMRRSLHERRIG
ncbi:hypothetical protein CGRA01v4_04794 [Colletotrichum graminicola]|nr:hypothetical protein CGRA01v4_04794 [Colletotrichum graminicola]